MPEFRVLAVNPGSTSTKIAVYDDREEVFSVNLSHPAEEISKYAKIMDQYEFRRDVILKTLEEKGIEKSSLSAVVGRGGLLRPIPGGTYQVNERMTADLKAGLQGEHASNLGGLIAWAIAEKLGIPSFIVDPVVVDEMEAFARYTGRPEIKRRSIFHALNQKAAARKAAEELGKRYEELNLIVAHLGGGISIGAHKKGRVVDVNNALNGDGPIAPERAGSLPAWDLVGLVLDKGYGKPDVKKLLAGKGGVVAFLGTNDMRDVEERVKAGDEEAEEVLGAVAYTCSKEIGARAAVMAGKVDAIVLTGGLAFDKKFVEWIRERVEFIAPLMVYAGENEMESLAQGALRVLSGEENAKEY
ncbi:butyrate kinase [candidate division WOR-3 bacterium]|uniref:Probable butyrate kinase n=1 Tax=candidate division WOR-3 bacterium TaxID=2052148 RepID=A0A9D5QCE2_UNCW3|nr:butyrate kinase [candidate division WOR-3 bacterium]MBD3364588.1 butyrate kinase [candidate division WOR-3 bacterium]